MKVNLKGGYKTVQEGERVLEITKAEVTPSGAPSKLTLNMRDVEDGATLLNTYNFTNETSMWAMGVMLSVALGLEDGDEFDTKDAQKLVGVKLICEVVHKDWNDKKMANIKKVIEKVDTDAEMTELAESVANTLYSRSDLDTEDELD